MGPIYSLNDVIDFLRRRGSLMLLVIALGSVVSVLFALSRAHEYRSSEVIQVVRPKIATDLVASTVEGSSARRLQFIEQRLMARSSVLEIIEAYELYTDRPDLTPTQKVDLLRRAVRIEGTAAAREGYADDGSVAVLTVTATMPTPEQAQQLAQELSHRIINLSISSRISQARETLNFFTEQLDEMTAQVAAKAREITAFRENNDLIIPGGIEFRRTEITSLNEALLALDRERLVLLSKVDQVDRTVRKATAARLLADYEIQLDTLDNQRRLLNERKAELEQSIETSPEVERRLGELTHELEQLQTKLDLVTAQHTEAEVGLRLETQRQSERLTVLEPAPLPEYPVSGNRKKIAVLGGALSVFVAIALAFFLDLKNPVIRSAAQMEREIGIRPVVSVPFLDATPEHARRGAAGQGPAAETA